MQIIDINRPFFVDSLPAPNTVAVKQKFAFTNFQNTKQYWSMKFEDAALAPFTYNIFDYESWLLNPNPYSKYINVNGNGIDSYQYLQNLVLNNAFKIWWIRINWNFKVITDPQLAQPLFYNYKDANGIFKQEQLLDLNDLDIYQKDFSTINIDLRNSNIILDQVNYLSYQFVQTVTPNTPATFNMYYEQSLQSDVLDEMKDISNLLTEF
jgi:hypothetical protein